MALCRSLPAGELQIALAEGEALSLEQAVAEAAKGLRRARAAHGWGRLTGRELQVVELVGAGLANLEIAERLVISPETVKTHLSNIFSKLGMAGRSELAREVRSRNSGPR
jgi:DNA-binding NarL/FixJ family response regulator